MGQEWQERRKCIAVRLSPFQGEFRQYETLYDAAQTRAVSEKMAVTVAALRRANRASLHEYLAKVAIEAATA